METFLNLVWLSLSFLLFAGCFRSLRKRGLGLDLRTVVAVGLLVILLFPAISMTDDLLAMNSPAEIEHILHFDEAAVVQATAVALLWVVPTAVEPSALVSLGIVSAQIRPLSFAAKTLAGYARSLGIRGPSSHVPLSYVN